MVGLLFDLKIDLNPSKSWSELPSHGSDLKLLAIRLDIHQKVPVGAFNRNDYVTKKDRVRFKDTFF